MASLLVGPDGTCCCGLCGSKNQGVRQPLLINEGSTVANPLNPTRVGSGTQAPTSASMGRAGSPGSDGGDPAKSHQFDVKLPWDEYGTGLHIKTLGIKGGKFPLIEVDKLTEVLPHYPQCTYALTS